ncbi:MAG TPA: MMPL family transporter [Polyangiaceae bacterium]|nr:MMPL family transporter [Polyangiaceae bacterium]
MSKKNERRSPRASLPDLAQEVQSKAVMMRRRPLEPILNFLADWQTKRPWAVVALVILSLLPAGFAASRLELRTAFSELLPSEKASVKELQRVNERVAGSSTLTVVAEGGDVEGLKKFVDKVSPRIRKIGPDYVASVDDGTREVQKFFQENKHLYAELDDLKKLHADVIARYDYEVGKEAGFDLGITDDEDGPPEVTAESLEKRFQKKVDDAKKKSKGVDGYYIGEDGKLAAILVRTPLGSGDDKAFELRATIEKILEEEEKALGLDLSFGYTGNLITSAEQHRAVKNDLAHVGAWGVGLILAVVLLFFLRFRTLLAMGSTILVGCVWAFGMAEFTVGYLNTATGFLVSIIAGNGINFGIIYMARFLEARRDEGLDPGAAVRVSHRDTHTATLAAAGAAMIAYGSLAATDFKGFKHFGIIGGAGMILCWVATYAFLPAILVLSERYSPMFTRKEPSWRGRMKGFYGYPFALAARKWPRIIAVAGALTGIGAAVLTVRYFVQDPMEYDLANVRNERLSPTSAGRLSLRVDKIVGRLGQDGRAILTDRLDQVQPLVSELEKRRDAAPKDRRPFDRVVSIFDILPQEQPAKLKLLKEIDERLQNAKKRGFIKAEDWKKLEQHIPSKLSTVGIDDLPELVARPFTEKDGRRGNIVFIVPTEGRSVYDAHYLLDWADSFREVSLPNGDIIRGSGDPVIFADMLINIGEDAPKAILLSLIGTFLVIVFAFRGKSGGWLALLALLLGVLWLVAFLSLRDIKLNFLNFVALPISIGVGADYAINVMKRRQLEGDEVLYSVLVQTGGAVVLCSLTTTLGYLALLLSINRAVQSFGLAAAVGEVTTLFAAVLILPALLFWRAKRKGLTLSPSSVGRRSMASISQDS